MSNTIKRTLTNFNSIEKQSFLLGDDTFKPLRLNNFDFNTVFKMDDRPNISYLDFVELYSNTYQKLSNLPLIEKNEYSKQEQEALEMVNPPMRLNKAEGGFVKGKDDVPYTKEDPSDRVDPFTGSPYSDQMARLGLAEGGLAKLILSVIQKDPTRNYTDEEIQVLRQHANYVGNAESDNIPNRKQLGGGPGRGKYQYEIATENKPGQQGAKTAFNRYINLKNKYGLPLTKKDIALSKEESPDFSTLSEDMQDAIFYADKAMGNMPVGDLVKGKLSHEDAWADYHWAGDPVEREEKINYFIGKNYMPQEITRGKLKTSSDYK
jgi:hypothetical protein